MAVICPECQQGKCVNCDGEALDPTTDEIVACTHQHRMPS